jgi:hypothetical protein
MRCTVTSSCRSTTLSGARDAVAQDLRLDGSLTARYRFRVGGCLALLLGEDLGRLLDRFLLLRLVGVTELLRIGG